ncbi:MAG: type II secretion system protein [Mariprofundaceae bacterium]
MARVRERGFTLIELLVTTVIALIVLGGLLLNFQSQYGQYKYQHKRTDAVQDMESVMRLLAQDLENALVVGGNPQITIQPDPYTSPTAATTDLNIILWEPELSFWNNDPALRQSNQYRAERHWQYDAAAQSLKLDRNTRDGGDSPSEALRDVTWFQVWEGAPPAGISDAPPADPYGLTITDDTGAQVVVPQYTVLIEMRVPVGVKGGVKRDVFGNPTADPRLHRYLQMYPMAVVSQ